MVKKVYFSQFSMLIFLETIGRIGSVSDAGTDVYGQWSIPAEKDEEKVTKYKKI